MTGPSMKAMVLEEVGQPLRPLRLPRPKPGPEQVLIAVRACGVCRTDLHIHEGDLQNAKRPLILGHEIVGTVEALGKAVRGLKPGERIGVPWLGKTCGHCAYCETGRENLCDRPAFTGYDIDGGYAEYALADARYCFSIPEPYGDAEAAPLLCAGLIGYRAYRMAGKAKRIGLYGFGAAAHIVAQIALYEGRRVYAFTRVGDQKGRDFARKLGAHWAGDSETPPPEPLDAALLFAPVGALVPKALASIVKGGIVVCAGIHMSEIPAFDYALLWGERQIRSVANLTRQDGIDFFKIAQKVPVKTAIETFPLGAADTALKRLKAGKIQGAAVLVTAGESQCESEA